MPENAVYNWDAFDSDDYVAHNYAELSDADRRIVETIRDFFGAHAPVPGARGVDVGSGANLYPALSMLPFCEEICLLEHSASNVAWLRDEVADYSELWDPYWTLLTGHEAYRRLSNPRAALAERARVHQVDLLNEACGGQWDIGTMFFVAESFSTSLDEFRAALRRFGELLSPGSPFAVAFMENSQGYEVGGLRFPAVAVDRDEVQKEISRLATEFVVSRISLEGAPLREGYTGMLVAYGRVKHL